jgi:nucleoside-diphosphate-sugar epimerase
LNPQASAGETILITGTGLIASYSGRLLRERGLPVVFVSPHASAERLQTILGPHLPGCAVERGDVRDLQRLRDLLVRHRVTRILHAGGFGGTRVNEVPFEAFGVNVQGFLTLLEAARLTGVQRTVLVSSIFVYRTDPPLPLDQPAVESLAYPMPANLYSAYKSAAEIAARAFARHTGMSVLNMRLAGAYGRGDFSGGGETAWLLQDLVRRALSEPAGTSIEARFRAGERIYAHDVADGLTRALFAESPRHDVFNLGSGEIIDPANFAAAVNQAVPGAAIVPVEAGPADTPLVDLTRIREELGYQPRWPLARAIADFANQLRAEGVGGR